jgi:glycosyltransferase involved in cell wall biosynthesis
MKQNLVISCPATSRSGYGDHARDLIRSLISMDKFNIKILDQRWGQCPQNSLTKEDEDIFSRLIKDGKLRTKPDVWIQVTVPNEFQPVGEYNIGITAGMETTLVDPTWLEGCNRMDRLIVPSVHAKQVFEQSKYDKHDKASNTKTGELKCEVPIDVLFEGSDMNIFKKIKKDEIPVTVIKTMEEIKEEFCFLSVGHWLQGDFGHDRKDIGGVIKVICESFSGKKNKPALILKTSGATYSIKDREQMLHKIRTVMQSVKNNAVSVYLLHGDMTPNELNGLYNHPKVKAMVSFTHGEGYGRPLQEFSITGKPVIAPGWSGQLDFLSEYGILLKGQVQAVHESAAQEKMILKEAGWFYCDVNYATAVLKDVYKNYKKYLESTRKQTQYIKENFTLELMKEKFKTMMNEEISKRPKQVELKLPKLETTNA